ncbi:serine/threonine-protein kinase prp4 [Metarhizium album ARSEF 1941]|uniref:non-specific serine/threonine protein kinase n=1 Tax=Metarhizium album (strain ARSEF 1941) TaxID=1081103 RepID=A0A0B2WT28_METAS|nr:serine/threonine-protein kinase prp4 [Metarhizium album ARSEF 1941]KHN96125.1 serine/threonine-protein kinase prp4 [Metarhizium album ARSEF 1941]
MASSSDEGEIIEEGHGDLKATSLAHHSGNGIDRQDRPRSGHSCPDRDCTSRYSGSCRRSRSPRGYKRVRDDGKQYTRGRDPDSRRVRARFDDSIRGDYRRSRISYDDLDRPSATSSNYDRRYDGDMDRDRHPDRARYPDRAGRPRSRSPRAPQRFGRSDNRRFAQEGQNYDRDSTKTLHYDDDRRCRVDREPPQRSAVTECAPAHDDAVQQPAKPPKGILKPSSTFTEPDDYEEPEPINEDAEIERRRRRREELLAKSSSATPLLLHAVGAAAEKNAQGASPASTQQDTPQISSFGGETPRTPRSDFASPRSPEPSPGGINLLNDKELMNTHSNAGADDQDGPSAADYDPTADMKEDERRDELRHGHAVIHGESVAEAIETNDDNTKNDAASAAEVADDGEFDMFADDVDVDNYASKNTKAAAATGGADGPAQAPQQADDKGGILEGDDKDGYYKIRIGEILDGRYQVQATLGRGMFSGVARAVDVTTKQVVAIKMMRNNDALRKGGYTEIAILQKLNDADPEKRKHIVKFERHFDYRGHLCMAFENLSMNLREVLRKFGNNVGINLGATRTYAHQIFVALAHMRKCSIIHADLKPDNILVNEQRNVLKICDLGTAIDRSDAATAHNQLTPYLVSRFYRAPEIILGMPYDYGVDMWSIGCTLYELYTGKILFTGDSNNQMLKAIMEIRGRFTPKLFRRGQLSAAHFDEQGQFVSVERDKVLGKTAVRTLAVVKPTRDLRTRLNAASTGMSDTEARHLNHFIDLLEQCLALNPDKRITPSEALKHPFFGFKTAASNGRR